MPSPGRPSTPAPGAPTTGRPGAGPVTGGATPRAGLPLTFERQATSKQRLQIDWDFPLPAVSDKQALQRNAALARIRGNDPRPLLVLRECERCQGTDRALLSRNQPNDRTALLTRWFHCVKLPGHVVDPAHPFHELFGGESPPHLLLLDADSDQPVPFDGAQSQAELWATMMAVLRRAYVLDPEAAMKKLVQMLDHFDHLDSMKLTYEQQLDQVLQKQGADSEAARTLQQKLARLAAQKTEMLEREKRLSDLQLRKKA